MDIRRDEDDTQMAITASVGSAVGALNLTVDVPDGVTLTRDQGDWTCHQTSGRVVCVSTDTRADTRSGTIHTTGTPSAQGLVRASVEGTYPDGSPATAFTEAQWPGAVR